MTTIELEAKKTEAIRGILSIENGDFLDTLCQTIRKYLSAQEKMPCNYTLEEVKSRLAITERDALEGKGISEEEANRIIELKL